MSVSGISKECVRCGDDAVAKCVYQFEQADAIGGTVEKKYWYCESCARYMHDVYRIDAVIQGDFEVLE